MTYTNFNRVKLISQEWLMYKLQISLTLPQPRNFLFFIFFFKYKLIQAPKWSLNEAKGRLWEKKVRWHFYSKTVTSISFNLCSVYWGRISVSSFHLRAPLQSHTPCVIFVSSSPGTDSQSVSRPAGPEDTQCRKWCPLACSKEEQLFLCCRSHNSLNLKT